MRLERVHKTTECFSCGRTPTHTSPNGRVLLCDIHVRTLPGTSRYVSLPPGPQS